MFAYDVDGDGDNDIITSLDGHGYGLVWFENVKDGNNISFKQHVITGSKPEDNAYGVKFSQIHAICLADMDGDGLKDIVTGKRYSIVPDEVLQYAYKYYGEPPAPIDPNVMDMIMASDRAREVGDNPPAQPSESELRKQHGTDDDDELILKALIPQPDIDAMRAAGPVRRDYPLLSSSELDEVRKLMSVASSPIVQVRSDQFNLTLRRSSGA